jgi:hypothetical protein
VQQLLGYLPLLACPVGMGLMMWMMMRGGKQPQQPTTTPPTMSPQQQAEFQRLRTELDELRASGQPGEDRGR